MSIEKISNTVISTYTAIQNGVVKGYLKIQNGAVSGYKQLESACIRKLFARKGETVEEAKARLSDKTEGR